VLELGVSWSAMCGGVPYRYVPLATGMVEAVQAKDFAGGRVMSVLSG
jgi:hypothetical protein